METPNPKQPSHAHSVTSSKENPCSLPSTPEFNQSDIDMTISSFLSLSMFSSPVSIRCSFDRVLDKVIHSAAGTSHDEQDCFLNRTRQLASLLYKCTIRKQATLQNYISWPLFPELTTKVFSMLDTKSLIQASACCTMFNKFVMDPECYSHIDLTTGAKHVDNGVVSIMIHRAGKKLGSLKLGSISLPAGSTSLLTRSCLTPLTFNHGFAGGSFEKSTPLPCHDGLRVLRSCAVSHFKSHRFEDCWTMFRGLPWRAQQENALLCEGLKRRFNPKGAANYHTTKTTSQTKIQKSQRQPLTNSGDSDIKEWNVAISSYMRTGRCNEALRVFKRMPRWSSVSYNAMISGYLRNGEFELAKMLFDEMPQRDLVSWNVMIKGYVRNRNLGKARELFERMPERDICSWNTMLSGYAQNGCVDDARRIFNRMPEKNEVSWNALLSAYVQNSKLDDACILFRSREDWALVSWNCLLGGFVKKKKIVEAREFFDAMKERDVVSWNTIITGYAQGGKIDEARQLFEKSPVKDVFTWTAMVSGYIQNQLVEEARELFDKMPERNEVSWNAMLAGYVQDERMEMAKELFDAMPCRNISTWNTMITGYAQCGKVSEARNLFDKMPKKDPVSWAAMIAGYSQSGYSYEALRLFVQMEREGGRLNRSSFSSALSTCADVVALELGKQLHGRLVKGGYENGCFVGNALLLMYCKCGSIEEANDLFKEMDGKDIVSWNTLVAGYSRHGFGKEALRLFESMKREGLRPDDATLVSVLSACSHTGLVDKGRQYFYNMTEDYGIKPNSQHYACMVDLLGRAGLLEEAHNLMKNMPFEPDAAFWGTLLGASRIHGNAELAEAAADKIFAMEPQNSGMYVLLSNLYASSGRWGDIGKLRVRMRDKGVKKVPGYSWIEIQNKTHTFSVGDVFHPEKDKIYAFLEDLELRMKKAGYVSKTSVVLHDVEEEEKERMVWYHSERLAVAYGIMHVSSGRPIRVIKNLRVCEDCHNAIKYMAKITGRVIILRDNNRFHHFKDGSCSCGDYW